MVSQEEWDEWTQLETTKMFHRALREIRIQLLEDWAAGAFTGSNVDETVQQNSRALGKVQQLEDLMEIDYDTISRVLGQSS